MTIDIRPAEPADVPGIHALMGEFAEFENLLHFFTATPDDLHAAIFGEAKFVSCLAAHSNAAIVAYALFFPHYSSFGGDTSLFLEDLYVSPESRGTGIGSRMLSEVARAGRERGFTRIDFHVLDWNEKAIRFYKALGARVNEEDRHFAFDGDAFVGLAEGA